MRVALNEKTFRYFQRVAEEYEKLPVAVLIAKIGHGGPMTRRIVLAELARREGAVIAKKRE